MEKRIYLEKFTPGDFDKYYKLVGNEEVMAMITKRAIPMNEATDNFSMLLSNNELHESFGYFKIIESVTNNFIGLAKLKIKEKASKEAELGYALLPNYWGMGIGSEVAKLLVGKAKEEGNLNSIMALIDPNNIASRKILINNGLVSEKICEMDGLPTEKLSMKI